MLKNNENTKAGFIAIAIGDAKRGGTGGNPLFDVEKSARFFHGNY